MGGWGKCKGKVAEIAVVRSQLQSDNCISRVPKSFARVHSIGHPLPPPLSGSLPQLLGGAEAGAAGGLAVGFADG